MSVTIRPFRKSDVEFAAAQARREGWKCPAQVFEVIFTCDPNLCFIAEVEGRRAGMVSATCYARSASIGGLIVEPDCRRQGVGERLMRHVIARLEDGGIRTLRLAADPMGVGIYKRLGFVPQFDLPRCNKPPPHDIVASPADRIEVADWDSLCALDTACFGDDRSRLLREFMSIALATYCIRANQQVVGFAMALPAVAGVCLGPLVAQTPEYAGHLVDALTAEHRDQFVTTAVPSVNTDAVSLFASRGFDHRRSSLRMCRGVAQAESDTGTLYALASGATG